jgi:hypothetical protein
MENKPYRKELSNAGRENCLAIIVMPADNFYKIKCSTDFLAKILP